MAPFGMLYGRRCQTPIFRNETGERQVFGPNIIQETMKQVRQVRENLKVAQSPMRGLKQFQVRGKLTPRFIWPFKILEQMGEVAYRLELPLQLSAVHDVFYMCQLKKCLWVLEEQVPSVDLVTGEDLEYHEYHIKVLETSERVTRNKTIRMCKVQWNHDTKEEAMWEWEEDLMAEFPNFSVSSLLVVLKPKRIIHKHMYANCSRFHLRVFVGLSNPQG
jgi:hypothetical protein